MVTNWSLNSINRPKQIPNKKQTKNKQIKFQTNKKTAQMPCGGRFLGRQTDK
jgi:hypothetical protein